ncbi:MAG TPA: hypothetical protein VN085_11515 [Vicinamibacterales bacterium]|nr:hypothetical protein [Vicinamibacterales bacterium]
MIAAYWATWALATVDPWAILGVVEHVADLEAWGTETTGLEAR